VIDCARIAEHRPPPEDTVARIVLTHAVVALVAATLALALPAGAAADGPADGVLVRYRAGTTAAHQADARQRAGVEREAGLALRGLEVDGAVPGGGVDRAIEALNRDPDVLYAEPDRIVRVRRAPNDSLYVRQWGLRNTGQGVPGAPPAPVPVAGADIHAEAAWEVTTGDPGVVVAVVDTGVDATHPDLAPNVWTNPREVAANGIDDDGNGFVDDVHGWDFVGGDDVPADETAVNGNPGHGTHVAGTIAARGDDGAGVAGVTWSSRLMPVRAFDQAGAATTARVVSGLVYAAANGARIVNVSFGAIAPSQAERDAIASFPSTLFVVAAGNDGVSTDSGDQATCAAIVGAPGFNPANPPRQCSFPCDYGLPNTICVAASDGADGLASFSDFGSRFVDLAAPGETIWSTVPGGSWASLSGTSMSVGFVAGAAALTLTHRPTLTAAQLRQALLQGVDAKASLTGKVATGGRLSAAGALAAADAIVPRAEPAAPPAPAPAPPPAAAPAPVAPSETRAPDRTAPRLALTVRRRARLGPAVRRGLRARARCSEPCTLSYVLRLDARTARRLGLQRTVARATRRVAVAGSATTTLRLPRALRRVRVARLTLRVRATDVAGNTATRTATIVLRR
jgi:subtilisin family serine protease